MIQGFTAVTSPLERNTRGVGGWGDDEMRGATENKREAKITGRKGVTATLNLQEKKSDLVVWLNYAVDCGCQENPVKT